MLSSLRTSSLARLLVGTMFAASLSAFAAELKGFYGGSGGISPEVYRFVLVEFATDGTAIVQQNWTGKEPQVWRTRWTQNGDQVTVTFDPVKDSETPKPLHLTFKHGTLTATDWDAKALGIGGPPKLTPFGGKNAKPATATPCAGMNSRDPTSSTCPTWDSRR